MKRQRLTQFKGFTLIELIATIAIAGIILIMILPYFHSGITESHRPAFLLQDAVAIQWVMEEFNAFYNGTAKTSAALTDLKDNKIQGVNTNHFRTISSTPPYTVYYKIVENKYITFDNPGNEVDDAAGTNRVLKVTIQSTTNPGYQLTQLFTVL